MLTTRDICDAIVARAEQAGLDQAALTTAARLRPDVAADLYARSRMPCVSTRRRIALALGTTPELLIVDPEESPC